MSKNESLNVKDKDKINNKMPLHRNEQKKILKDTLNIHYFSLICL